jgi:hypothetical protein
MGLLSVKNASEKLSHLGIFKGTVPRDFSLQIFFTNHLPQASDKPKAFFHIFSKILGDITAQLVSLTPVANGKNRQSGKF